MKILRRRLQDASKLGGVNQLVIERDYAQSYILFGLGNSGALRDTLVFKGGTALKKVYFDGYRFSEDLDFSVIDAPTGADLEAAIAAAVVHAQEVAREMAPIAFSTERIKESGPHPRGQEAFLVRVQFPWHREPLVPVKLEVTHDEPVILDAKHQAVRHGYDESLDGSVRTYCLEEIAAEKLRATQQTLAKLTERGWSRPRARDYYDLWHLIREPETRLSWERVASVLAEKCRLRSVSIRSVEVIFDKRLMDEVKATWQPTLGPFVRDLPPVKQVIEELQERLAVLLKL